MYVYLSENQGRLVDQSKIDNADRKALSRTIEALDQTKARHGNQHIYGQY